MPGGPTTDVILTPEENTQSRLEVMSEGIPGKLGVVSRGCLNPLENGDSLSAAILYLSCYCLANGLASHAGKSWD